MIPGEKALVERLKDKPFALIGINSDGNAAAVQKILADQGISWRQAVDGSTNGPLSRAWKVSYWPNIFVIDGSGKIRAKDLRGHDLDSKVEELLKELAASQATPAEAPS